MLHILLSSVALSLGPTAVPAEIGIAPTVSFLQEAEESAKGEGKTKRKDREKPQSSSLSVEQIPTGKADGDEDSFQIAIKGSDETGEANVGQLPGDLELADDESGPEQAISKPYVSPEAALYGQVAEAWQVIRQRGQQPTPELIAREIGPDTLARFLDQNPAAGDIFGQDSDDLPVDEPGPEQLPEGGIFILPPGGG